MHQPPKLSTIGLFLISASNLGKESMLRNAVLSDKNFKKGTQINSPSSDAGVTPYKQNSGLSSVHFARYIRSYRMAL